MEINITSMSRDNKEESLIPKLSSRIGMLKRISRKYIPKKRLKNFVRGIFYSKYNYCLSVFGNVFGLKSYKESKNRHTSFMQGQSNTEWAHPWRQGGAPEGN